MSEEQLYKCKQEFDTLTFRLCLQCLKEDVEYTSTLTYSDRQFLYKVCDKVTLISNGRFVLTEKQIFKLWVMVQVYELWTYGNSWRKI